MSALVSKLMQMDLLMLEEERKEFSEQFGDGISTVPRCVFDTKGRIRRHVRIPDGMDFRIVIRDEQVTFWVRPDDFQEEARRQRNERRRPLLIWSVGGTIAGAIVLGLIFFLVVLAINLIFGTSLPLLKLSLWGGCLGGSVTALDSLYRIHRIE